MSGTLTLDEMNATGNFISSVQGGSSPSSLGGEVSAISEASHYSKVTSRPRAYFQKEGRATTKDPILARPRHSQYSLHPNRIHVPFVYSGRPNTISVLKRLQLNCFDLLAFTLILYLVSVSYYRQTLIICCVSSTISNLPHNLPGPANNLNDS